MFSAVWDIKRRRADSVAHAKWGVIEMLGADSKVENHRPGCQAQYQGTKKSSVARTLLFLGSRLLPMPLFSRGKLQRV